MPFSFTRLEIPDVLLIEAKTFGDQRGFFKETFKRSEFEAYGITDQFVQDNFSYSTRGVLRGLHYQKHPKAQGKLVMALRGKIFDVAVDIRKGSSTFGKWVGHVLSSDNHRMMYVPTGFAHGFAVLSEEADVLYKITGGEYTPELERGIIWNDPQIGVKWLLEDPILTERDANLPPLQEADCNFEYRR